MDKQRRALVSGLLCGAIALVALAGCDKPADPVTQAAKTDAAAGVPAPGIAAHRVCVISICTRGALHTAARRR